MPDTDPRDAARDPFKVARDPSLEPSPEPIRLVEYGDGLRVLPASSSADGAIEGWVMRGVESAESFGWTTAPDAGGRYFALALQALQDGWQVAAQFAFGSAQAAEQRARELWASDNT